MATGGGGARGNTVSEGLRILAPRTPVLATALVTANQTVAAAAGTVDITGMSITFTVPGVPSWVEMWIGWVAGSVATGNTNMHIADGSNNEVARMWGPPVAAGGVFGPWHMKRRLYTPLVTPGATLTLKGRVQVVSGATSALNMGTDTLPAAGSGAAPPGFITAYTE
jgi:hypothetical protein